MTFSIYDKDYNKLEYDYLVFSGGEVQVKIKAWIGFELGTKPLLKIKGRIVSSESVIELLMLVDALRRMIPKCRLKLVSPYFPYARQDRVCYPGEAFSLKVFANLINDLNFESVEIWDPHSEITPALLDRVEVVPQRIFVNKIFNLFSDEKLSKKNLVLVAPDVGAIKKTREVASSVGLPFIHADKIRNPENGNITGTKVYAEELFVGNGGYPKINKDFLIVDDICDGGRTFVELAKELRKITVGKIYLYVTHGIFSKGFEVFDGLIDHIYCANAWKYGEKMTVIA